MTPPPRLSIVMPVHNTAAYLPECVASVVGQAFQDWELIAVDDASTDDSRALLDAIAAAEPRLKVLATPSNVGAGAARNLGLLAATGDYVWFVDSDDTLAEGALDAIAAALDGDDPDALLFGWIRVYEDGTEKMGTAEALLRAAPAAFTLRDWPRAIEVFQGVWNKAYRRRFLVDTGIGFDSGWYEDIPHTYGVLAQAARIAALDRVCLEYRQHPGSAMRQRSPRHFEVFEHWDGAMALVGRRPETLAELRPHLVRRMLWQFVSILKNPRKLTWRERPAFFARAVDLYRRHGEGVAVAFPGGWEGGYYRAVAMGSYPLFAAWLAADRLKITLARRLGLSSGHGRR